MKTKVIQAIVVFWSILFSSCSKSNMATADKVYLFNAGELSVFANEDILSADLMSGISPKKELTYFNGFKGLSSDVNP